MRTKLHDLLLAADDISDWTRDMVNAARNAFREDIARHYDGIAVGASLLAGRIEKLEMEAEHAEMDAKLKKKRRK